MNTTLLLFVSFFASLQLCNATCCLAYRKICETLKDVKIYGDNEWESVIIMPGKCENSTTLPQFEEVKKEDFEKATNLKNVYIVDKVIQFREHKPFEPLQNSLVYLSIIRNNISEIGDNIYTDLPRLKKLVLRDSEISVITPGAFKNLPKLEVLLLSGNKITQIKNNILNDIEIKTVDLSFNQISIIEETSFPNSLILLNLKKNEIKNIPDAIFSNLRYLEMLILSKNKLSQLRKGMFTGLGNLSKLDLSKNKITSIEPDTFSDLHELMFLYLKYNQLRVIHANIFLKDMINLTDFELDNNNLTSLEEGIFQRMPNLEEISIGNNPWNCENFRTITRIINTKEITISDVNFDAGECNK